VDWQRVAAVRKRWQSLELEPATESIVPIVMTPIGLGLLHPWYRLPCLGWRVRKKLESEGRGFEAARSTASTPRLLTVKEAARILCVRTATVYAMTERGELPHGRLRNAIRIVVAGSETALDEHPEPR